jgi:hypothetical protein
MKHNFVFRIPADKPIFPMFNNDYVFSAIDSDLLEKLISVFIVQTDYSG